MSLVHSLLIILILINALLVLRLVLANSDLRQQKRIIKETLREKDRLRAIIKNFKNLN